MAAACAARLSNQLPLVLVQVILPAPIHLREQQAAHPAARCITTHHSTPLAPLHMQINPLAEGSKVRVILPIIAHLLIQCATLAYLKLQPQQWQAAHRTRVYLVLRLLHAAVVVLLVPDCFYCT